MVVTGYRSYLSLGAGTDVVVTRSSDVWWVARVGAPGLVLNALVLFTTRYMDDAANQLRSDGFDVRDEDMARLSPFARHHSNMAGPLLLPAARSARRC